MFFPLQKKKKKICLFKLWEIQWLLIFILKKFVLIVGNSIAFYLYIVKFSLNCGL